MNRNEFVEAVTSMDLVSTDEVTTIEKANPQAATGDGQALARLLVQQEKLTKFQAAAIYQGKGKALVYGEYIVLDRIGAGGMGQVFKARHRRMDRIVALKVMSQAAIKSPEAVKRFEREVRAAAKLTHPNIVHAYDAGVQDGARYLVMEFVEGGDFSSLLKQHTKFGIKQACGFFEQAARGFAAAHAKGVVHRDVKPGNLLVDKAGVVKVLDMGLARFDDESVGGAMNEGELTQSGSVMGTVDYMAPEQALNTRHADAKSDVYGLGCTFYRILTGEPVFGGQTLVEKILAHRDHAIPSIRRLRPDAPPVLDVLISRMLAKNPADRPTMQEVADGIAAIGSAPPQDGGYGIASEPTAAPLTFPDPSTMRSTPGSNTFAPGTVFSKPAPAAAPHPQRKKSSMPILAGAGIVGLLVVGAGLAFLLREKPSDASDIAQVSTDEGEQIVPAPAPAPIVPPKPTPTPVATPTTGRTNTAPSIVNVAVTSNNSSNNSTSSTTNNSTNTTNNSAISTGPEIRLVDPAIELRAAQKVIELGGTCFAQGPDMPGFRIASVSDIPTKHFVITGIDLFKTNTTDKDLETFVGLGSLDTISLPSTGVTDAGVEKCLKTLPHLQGITLNGCDNVSDATLQSLTELKRLSYLYLTDTKVTGAAAREFQKKVPNCRVTWTGGVLEGKPMTSRPPVTVTFRSSPIQTAGRSSIDQAILGAATPTDSTSTPATTPSIGSVASNSTTSGTSAAMPATGANSTTGTSSTGSSSTDTASAAAGPKKLPVPSAADQQAALKLVKEIFGDDYTAAKSFDQKGTLARKLLDQAKQTLDDTNAKFVLFNEARALATEASDVDTLFDALTPQLEEFDLPEAATLLDAWGALLKRPRLDTAAIQRVFNDSKARFDIAVTDARFDDAKQFGDFGLTIVRRLPNSATLVKQVTERNTALVTRQKEWPELVAMADKLKANADDAGANLAIARYQALMADEWASAFPRYAKSGDPIYVALAAKSTGDVTSTAAQVAAGDAWWDAAQAAKLPQKTELLAGAHYWYELVAPLLTGLPKTRVEKRRTELAANVVAKKIPPTTLPGIFTVTMNGANDLAVGQMPNRNFGSPSTGSSSSSSSFGSTSRPRTSNVDERPIAQALLGYGATLTLRIDTTNGSGSSNSTFRVTPRGILPADKFTVEGATFDGLNNSNDQVDEGELMALTALPNLRSLSVFNSRIDDKAFKALRGLQGLENLSLMNITNFNDEQMVHLRGLVNLRVLSIPGGGYTDAGMVNLKDLTNLYSLGMGQSQITGTGFATLGGLTQLRYVYLFSSQFNDAGMVQIQRLNSVQRLDLASTQVTDVGMASFKGLANLEYLSLRSTNTSDASLRAFESRPRLTHVIVSNRVTQAAAQALQKVNPSCRIEFPQ